MADIVRALGHRNYRLYFGGQLLSLVGTQMQQVALSWLVFRLTGSTAMLGLITFIGQIPSLFLAPFAGLLSDRFERRALLLWTQVLSTLHAGVLAALTFTGHISAPILLAMASVLGLINAVDQSVRQSFVAELVDDREDIPNAVALSSFTIHTARFIGPSIGGFLIAGVGEASCFALNALSFAGAIYALAVMRGLHVAPSRTSAPGALREGFRYVASHREIRLLMAIVATVSFFGSSYGALLPYFAKEIYHGDARSYGLLATSGGVGACLGTIFLASRRSTQAISRTVLKAMVVVSVALAGFALSRSFAVAVIALAVMGFASINTVAASSAVIQNLVQDGVRGRVMAIYTMAFFGVGPVGALATGYMARTFGASQTLLLSAAVILCVALAASWIRRGQVEQRELEAQPEAAV